MTALRSGFFTVAALVAAVSACSNGGNTVSVGSDGGGGGDDGGGTPEIFPKDVYALADRCVKIKAGGGYIKAASSGYTADPAATGNPVYFYMKAAGLRELTAASGSTPATYTARYIFFTKDSKYLTGDTSVTGETAPSDGADWTFNAVAGKAGTYTAAIGSQKLALDGSKALTMGATGAELTFEPATGCTVYPEMPVNVSTTYTGPAKLKDANGVELPYADQPPLIGFADIHAHMAMGSDMSDGSGDRGPSAGGVMYGHAVDRFGVVEALKDCVDMHGENGITSAELVLDTAPDIHETKGWPTFVNWPAHDSQLHQQMYYKWVERTYRAGLRLMVIHGTNIEALCDVAKKTSGSEKAAADCSDMGVGLSQVAYVHDMENYIDAQNGGPEKGWFRVVKSWQEADAAIRDGKMAVVPGLEFSNIFHCNVTYRPGPRGEPGDPTAEVVGCNKESIDAELEDAWNKGVRGIFLYHDVDSALGGTGIFSPVLNLVNYYGTKGFWDTYTCDDEWGQPDDLGYFYGAGTVPLDFYQGYPASFLNNPIGAALVDAVAAGGATLPIYPPTNQCNKRGITPLGRYALQAAMKKGFVLDIDHAEISIKQAMLDEAALTTPAYPMASAHGGHGGITNKQARQIVHQGGLIYPGMSNGREMKNFINKVAAFWGSETTRPLAVGYGADQNGLANQPGPEDLGVDYSQPITLFRGTGWSTRYANAGIPAVTLTQLDVPDEGTEIGQKWDVDANGIAHYGMIADMVEQLRQQSGPSTAYLDAFYRSADAYVKMWKQTAEASAARPEPTDPGATPEVVPHPIDPTTGSFP